MWVLLKDFAAGIYGNGYRRSLDVYFECRQKADYEMKQLEESEDN